MGDSALTKPDANECEKDLDGSIAEAAGGFARGQLGIHPSSIFVDQHGASVTITLKNALSESEKHAIRDERAAAMVARIHSKAFKAVAGILKARIGSILGKCIVEASLVLDVSTNRVSIFLETGEDRDPNGSP